MGFFSKIKENFTHGGVDVELQAPETVDRHQPPFAVTVTLTAKNNPQTIKSVSVAIVQKTEKRDSGSSSAMRTDIREISRVENTETFVLTAGETKTIQFMIGMDMASSEALADNPALAGIMGAFEKIGQYTQANQEINARYDIKASADVDGIMLDPSDTKDLKISGAGFHISLS